jgi:[ribosomal protein S5]-alanine N-acetyltransferase
VDEGITSIETARLVLRPLVMEDEEALAQVYCDAETMRWYPAPYTGEQVRERIGQQIDRYASGAGLLGMVEKQTGRLIGDCGVTWQDVEAVMEPEVGYHVHRERWGQGFATEAAKAVIGYAFNQLGVNHVISMIRPENVQSRRVAEKNGLTVNRVVFWRDYDHCVYELWKK